MPHTPVPRGNVKTKSNDTVDDSLNVYYNAWYFFFSQNFALETQNAGNTSILLSSSNQRQPTSFLRFSCTPGKAVYHQNMSQ